jgi:hypothetical protein
MVREGLALDYAKYSREYIREEDTAREQGRGMWAGAFIAPWGWRHRDRNTVILGALSVPITAQAQLLAPASSAAAPSPECTSEGVRSDKYARSPEAVVLLRRGSTRGRLARG